MTLKVYSYKPKVVELPMVGVYDVESDDFSMDEGLVQEQVSRLSQKDTDWLEGIAGLTEKQIVSLMVDEIKRRRRKK